jgi:hypothetical protein
MKENETNRSAPQPAGGGTPAEWVGGPPAPAESVGRAPGSRESVGGPPDPNRPDETVGDAPAPSESVGGAPTMERSRNLLLLLGGLIVLVAVISAVFGIFFR